MRNFIFRIFLFFSILLFLIFAFSLFYIQKQKKLNNEKAENSIFIWGDSQTFRGINLELLSKLTEKEVFSAASGGAGIYDFLVFADIIPCNAQVFIGISQPMQLRGRDKNRSGLTLFSLYQAKVNNYSWDEIQSIIIDNMKPERIFHNNSSLFPMEDSITLFEPMSKFEKYYKETPSYLRDKQLLYIAGIKKLLQKNCSIIILQFPMYYLLSDIEASSPIKNNLRNFNNEINALLPESKIDTLYLDTEKNLMHDLTHFNEHGANLLTDTLAKIYKSKKINASKIIVINGGVCR